MPLVCWLPHSGNAFLWHRSGNFYEGMSHILTGHTSYSYGIGWLYQLHLSGMWWGEVSTSLVWKTLKSTATQRHEWPALSAHMIRLYRFPELTSVYLLKPITARATTATLDACLVSVSCLVTFHSRDFSQRA